jgi:hypothetical protein
MVVDSELLELSIPDRFFAYAEAYSNGAKALTEKMASDDSPSNWPNAAVVLMLSAHSVELFLKGALFTKDPKAKINHHNIDVLFDLYCQNYTDGKFSFEMPFKTEYLSISEAEIKALREHTSLTPSVLYRYPTASGELEWGGAYGFEVSSFLPVLNKLITDFQRLRECLT